MDPKHKGTEFSNVRRVWEQNESAEPQPAAHERGSEFGNVSETWAQNERQDAAEKDRTPDDEKAD